MATRNEVFISYSHKDKKYFERLQTHLRPFLRTEQVNIWDDTKIQPGMNWTEEIRHALDSAKIAILLISADYLASDFIAQNELPPLLLAARQKGTVILSIILKPCSFMFTELDSFQAFNNPSTPLAKMSYSKREQLFAEVARYIDEALRSQQIPPLVSPTSDTTLLTYEGHNSKVRSVAWSPDGRRIASGSEDTTVQIWDATSGDQILTYRNHSHLVRCVAWSPDGRLIASGGSDGSIQVWDSATGNLILTYLGHSDWVYAIAWSPDGNLIASCGVDQTAQIWSASTGRTIFIYLGHKDDVRSIAWSPDGRVVASGGEDGTVQIWDAVEGKKLYTFQMSTFAVNTVEGKKLYIQKGIFAVNTVAWSHNGKYLASGSNNAIVQLWDLSQDSPFYTYSGHKDRVYSVTWSPHDQRIASGSGDATVQVWQFRYA